jgi:curved DNA-binding protein CbpA
MPPRPLVPTDDLYARLELRSNASAEAIEVAWRALLKRHHPDVAGDAGADERAKRINVAHDWLSDPALRARYDRERRGVGSGPAAGASTRGANGRWSPGAEPGRRTGSSSPPLRPRPVDAEEALVRHLDRVEHLTPDEIDRLMLAQVPPIAFVASIARFLSPELLARVDAVEGRVHERLPRAVRWNAAVRDSAIGFGQEIVLSAFLDEHLSEPFRERVRERLTRGWSAAVDQPRYGPNGAAVSAAIASLRALPGPELKQVAAAAAASDRVARGGPPWPPGLRPDEDDALRVSSELARRDAVAALAAPIPAPARRSLERAVHALVLRHAFPAPAFDDLVRPWRGSLGIDRTPRPSVRSDRRPRH